MCRTHHRHSVTDISIHFFLRLRPCPPEGHVSNWRGLLFWRLVLTGVTEDVWRADELWRWSLWPLCLTVSGASEALHHKISKHSVRARLHSSPHCFGVSCFSGALQKIIVPFTVYFGREGVVVAAWLNRTGVSSVFFTLWFGQAEWWAILCVSCSTMKTATVSKSLCEGKEGRVLQVSFLNWMLHFMIQRTIISVLLWPLEHPICFGIFSFLVH